jgi:putative hemolysin
MGQLSLEIFLIFILLVINGLFSMSEIAVVSARKIRLKKQAEDGDNGAATAIELAEKPDKFLSTVQIGITLVGILSGAFGGAAISEKLTPVVAKIEFLSKYAEGISFGIVVLIITYFSLVIGELVPKNLALNSPEKIATMVSRPMNFISKWTSPVVWLLSASTSFVLKILKIKESSGASITTEEIKAHIAHGAEIGVLDETEQDLMESVIRLDDQKITALMTPRIKVVWINKNDSTEIIKQKFAESNFSRLLVCEGDLDNVVGFVKAKDLLSHILTTKEFDLGIVIKQPLFVSETKTALELLELFKESHTQLAVVIDEFGSTEGIVTINDVLEAIVGDLPVGGILNKSAVKRDDGSWLLDARLSVPDFRDILGLKDLPADERDSYQTLAGFVLTRFEKLPKIGDKFEWENYIFEVVGMDGRRVDEVLASPFKEV